MTEEEVAAELPAFAHGELDGERQQQVEEYLHVHAEASALARDLRAIAVAGGPMRVPSAVTLLKSVKAGVAEQIGAAAGEDKTSGFRRWAAIAVAASLLVYLGVDVFTHQAVFAAAVSRLEAAQSVRIEGTVLAPGNTHKSVRFWLQKPHRYRIEIGEAGEQSTVITGDGESGQRLLVSNAERVFLRFYEPDRGPAAAKLAAELKVVLPAKVSMVGFSQEEVGRLTRFIFERGTTRGRTRNIIEIDREDRLLSRHKLSMLDGDRWVPVSDMSYTIAADILPDSLFSLEPPTGYRQAQDDGGRWWFERSLCFERAALFASGLRTARMTDTHEYIAGRPVQGDSTFTHAPQMVGGIWQLQALQRPLPEVFSAIGNGFTARTDDSELRQRRVSLTIYYRHGLSPEERVSILGKHLGVTAIFSDYVDSTETQFIFEQSGPIPARESFEPAPFKREELDDGRMRYVVASMPLIRLVRYAWWRSTDNRPGVYTWPASPGTSGVWKQLVDADFTTDGTWGQNASYLRERFGVIYETREKLLRTRFIELSQ